MVSYFRYLLDIYVKFQACYAQGKSFKGSFKWMILLMEEIRLTSWYGKSLIIYKVLYIPGGYPDFFHQQ